MASMTALMTAAWAQAQPSTSVSGHLRLTHFSSTRDLDDRAGMNGITGHAKLRHDLDDERRIELEGEGTVNRAQGRSETSGRLISAFASLRRGDFDFRVGQQRVRWGKADVVNPTDFFTPTDFRVPLPLEEDRYRSVPAIRTDWRVDEAHSLSLIVQPYFVSSALPRAEVPSGVYVKEEKPMTWRDPQVGLKWSRTGESLDWSVSAFRGRSNLPASQFMAEPQTGAIDWLQHYPRTQGLGMDLATTWGPWGLRLEAARTRFERQSGRLNPGTQYFAVAGADRAFDDVNLNVQVLYRQVMHWPHAPTTSLLDSLSQAQNALVFNQFNRQTWGVSTRIAAQWLHQTLQTELLYLAYFEPTSGVIRPLLTYALADDRKLIFGGEYYFGTSRSFFGPFKANRTWFAEFQQYL